MIHSFLNFMFFFEFVCCFVLPFLPVYLFKDEYPQTQEIQQRCVSMLADLYHAPGVKEHAAVGTATVGSSEAFMLGGKLVILEFYFCFIFKIIVQLWQ